MELSDEKLSSALSSDPTVKALKISQAMATLVALLTLIICFSLLLVGSVLHLFKLRRDTAIIGLVSVGIIGIVLTGLIIGFAPQYDPWCWIGIYLTQLGYAFCTVYFLNLSFNFKYCFRPDMAAYKRKIDILSVLYCFALLAGCILLTWWSLTRRNWTVGKGIYIVFYLSFVVC
jgi:hypothetical protein